MNHYKACYCPVYPSLVDYLSDNTDRIGYHKVDEVAVP